MITVTQILGTDAMNASRITINENFNTVASAINTLQSLVSTNQIGTPTASIVCSSLNAGQNGITTNGTVTCNGLTIGGTSLNEQNLIGLLALLGQ